MLALLVLLVVLVVLVVVRDVLLVRVRVLVALLIPTTSGVLSRVVRVTPARASRMFVLLALFLEVVFAVAALLVLVVVRAVVVVSSPDSHIESL